ncbi:hypothetical protein HDU90_004882 [Geranomyces variabilis]|nr:hypothetical protein HDU90_004882 [Geranomyces variabilis]
MEQRPSFSHRVDVQAAYLHVDEDVAAFFASCQAAPALTMHELRARHGFVSASKWDERYLGALAIFSKVVDVADVVPAELAPTAEELAVIEPFFRLSRSEVRDRAQLRSFDANIQTLYKRLAEVLAFSSDYSVGSAGTQGSDLQDKDENSVVSLLWVYLEELVRPFDEAGILDDAPMAVEVRSVPFSKDVQLIGTQVTCKTDGSVAVSLQSGRKSSTTHTSMLAQVAAELLSAAQHANKAKAHSSPEVFGILMHHRHIQIVSAVFSDGYLERVDHFARGIGAGDWFFIKATRSFDLGLPDDRRASSSALISLIKYIASGHARVGRLDELHRA